MHERLTPDRFGNNPTVVLIVAHERTRFDVHKRQLCDISPFFAAAFDGSFREKSGSMELSEDSPEAFELLVQWLNQGRLEVSWSGDNDPIHMVYGQMIRLYLTADNYQITSLMDSVIRILFNVVKHGCEECTKCLGEPPLAIVNPIYSNSTQGCQLRNFVVACYAWLRNFGWYEIEDTSRRLSTIPEFASDLAVTLVSRLKDGDNDSFWKDVSTFLNSGYANSESQNISTSSSSTCVASRC